MYIGSTHIQRADTWTFSSPHLPPSLRVGSGSDKLSPSKSKKADAASSQIVIAAGGHMELSAALPHNPGLLKLFDEILVNACDTMVRTSASDVGGSSSSGSASSTGAKAAAAAAASLRRMTRLAVTIDPGSNADKRPAKITIYNNGRGLPVVRHATEGGLWVPELVLGHLLTGSNFADAGDGKSPPRAGAGAAKGGSAAVAGGGKSAGAAAATGGRHGYGAKLTNIFSREFAVRTGDSVSGLQYRQTWSANMSACSAPVITPLKGALASADAAGGAGAGPAAAAGSTGTVSPAAAAAVPADSDSDFVEITFTPDLGRFEAPGAAADGDADAAAAATAGKKAVATSAAVRYELDAGTLALMVRRVVDAAGTLARFAAGADAAAADGSKRGRATASTASSGSKFDGAAALSVTLNGVPIAIGSFSDYSRLFTPAAQVPALATSVASAGSASASSPAAGAGKGKASAAASPAPAAGKGKAKGKAGADSASGDAAAAGADSDALPATAEGVAAALSRVAACTVDVGGLPWEVAVAPAGFPLPAGAADSPTPASASTGSAAGKGSAAGVTVPPLGSFNAPGAIASFVNNISTARGGTHVAAVMDALVRALVPLIQKKATSAGVSAPVTTHAVRAHLRLFVSALVRGASFDSQAKDALSTPLATIMQQNAAASAGSASSSASGATGAGTAHGGQLHLPDRFVRRVADELGVAALVIDSLRAKAAAEEVRALRRGTRTPESRIKAIPKLEDANLAGTKRGHECTLILTEGDSAKALAVAGLAVVGRDRYGVFPLRGKLLNVRDMTPREALGNAEVAALINILGLDFAKDYAGLAPADRGLRYGRVMIMADQDVDGAHIRGLLLNLFHHFWPRLLETPTAAAAGAAGTAAPASPSPSPENAVASTAASASSASASFLQSFVTPILKARRGASERQFFSIKEYEAWRREGELFTATASSAAATALAGNPAAAAERAAAEAAAAAAGRVFGESAKSGWTTKYYKGLGTSTSAEGRAYFSAMDRHVIPFAWGGSDDAARLEMAFAKSKADARKAWLLSQPADSDLALPPVAVPPAEALAAAASDVSALKTSSSAAAALAAPSSAASAAAADTTAAVASFDGVPSIDAFGTFDAFAVPTSAAAAPSAPAVSAVTTATTAKTAPSSSGTNAAVAASGAKAGAAAAPTAAARVAGKASNSTSATHAKAGSGAAGAATGSSPSAAPAVASPSAAPAAAQTGGSRALTYGEFVDRELVEFSKADLTRSVPSAIDGLKPSQRKVLFACFRRAGSSGSGSASGGVASAAGTSSSETDSSVYADEALTGDAAAADQADAVAAEGVAASAKVSGGSTVKGRGGATKASTLSPIAAAAGKSVYTAGILPPPSALGSEIKVAQLAGYVAETTAYHHGEASLVSTIQAMAQDFVGSNNVPLLQPLGQFGTRLQGGKDAASARYIFTRLSPLARLLFPAADEALLRRREDDGLRVEPLLYVPIVPLALLNGAMGIGTGWSTSVPPFHPLRVLDAVEAAIDALPPMDGSSNGSKPASAGSSIASSASAGGWWGSDLDAAEQAAVAALSGTAASNALQPWWRGFHGRVHPSAGDAANAAATGSASSFVIEGEVELLPPGAERQLQSQRSSSPAPAGSIALTGARSGRGAAGSAKTAASRGFATKASAAAGSKRGRGAAAVAADDHSSDSDDDGDADGDGNESLDGCTTVRISELPVGRWTEDYKAFLADLLQRGSVKGIREYHTETAAEFVIALTPQGVKEIAALPVAAASLASSSSASHAGRGQHTSAKRREQLLAYFRLRSSLSLRNMHLFDARGRIRRFASPADVVAAFLPLRAGLYRARKVREEASLAAQASMADAVHGFLAAVVGGSLKVSGRSRAELAADLRKRDTPLLLSASAAAAGAAGAPSAAAAAALVQAAAGAAAHLIDPSALTPGPHFIRPSMLATQSGTSAGAGADVGGASAGAGSYDYLLQLPLWRLTADSMQRTAAQAAAARSQLQAAQQRRSADIWRAELQRLRQGLQLVYPDLK